MARTTDEPTIEEVLDYADFLEPRIRTWYVDETERRRAERVAKETAPRELHGTTLVVGHLYDLTMRHHNRRNLLYLGTFDRGYRHGGVFVRIGPEGPSYNQVMPWGSDVQSATEVQPTPEQQAFIDEYMAKERQS